jgi:hypothetical protein
MKKGSALLTVMIIITIAGFFITSMTYMAKQQAFMSVKLGDRMRAEAIAEAGANYTYRVLVTNWVLRLYPDDPHWDDAEFADGYYSLDIEDINQKIAVIRSHGFYGTADAWSVIDARNFAEDLNQSNNSEWAWSKAIYSNGGISKNGSSGQILGPVHANDALVLNGEVMWGDPTDVVEISSSTSIISDNPIVQSGNIMAPEVNIPEGGAAEIWEGDVPMVDFPQLNFDSLYQTALNNGTVVLASSIDGHTDQDWTGIDVLWIEGNLKMAADIQFDGIIVLTGSYTSIGGGDVFMNGTNPDKKTGIISQTGSIKIGGNSDGEGLYYAPNNITIGGDIIHTGNIMAGGDVVINGNATIDFASNAWQPDENEIEDQIGIGAVQE